MEHFDGYNAYILIAVLVVTSCFFIYTIWSDTEAAVPYSVTPPEQVAPGWKGEVLQNPSLKVSHLVNIY